MRPAHLPRTEADLAAWRVYADALLAAGDRLGALLALELELPAAPSDVQLQQFQIAATQLRPPAWLEVAWCLGHARTVAVMPVHPDARRTGNERFTALAAFFGSAEAALVESVEAKLAAGHIEAFTRALVRAPPSCTEVALETSGEWEPAHAAQLVQSLPPRIDRLRVLAADPASFIHARLAVLDARYSRWGFSPGGPERLRQAAGAAPSLRLIAGNLAVVALTGAELCLPGDAGLFEPADRIMTLLPPPPLIQLTRTHGVIPVRAQLARSLPETHVPKLKGGSRYVRDGEGAWVVYTAKGRSVSIVTGTRLRHYGQERIFLADAALWPAYSASA